MAAGDIYYHALSSVGEDIGKAIQQNVLRQRKQRDEITRDMAVLDRLSQMPDPTDPTGKKTLVDEKKMIALRHLKGSQLQAAAEGELAAIQLGQQIYKSSAPIRSLMSGPQTTTDESGRQWRWTGREWIPIAQKGKEPTEQIDAPNKELNKKLAKFGMTTEDISQPTTMQFFGQKPDPSDPSGKGKISYPITAQGTSPIDTSKATHVQIKTANNKSATMPVETWREIDESFRNLQQKQPSELETGATLEEARQAIAQGASRDAVLARLKKMGIDPSGL